MVRLFNRFQKYHLLQFLRHENSVYSLFDQDSRTISNWLGARLDSIGSEVVDDAM